VTNLVVPFLAGQDATPTTFNAAIDNALSTKYQTADTIRNATTTYLDSTDLVLPLLANAAYTFDSCLFYDSSTTADVKIRLSLPAGSAALIVPWASTATANTTSTNAINQQASVPASNIIEFAMPGIGSGSIMSARPSGWINVSTTAGNLVIGHTQNTSSAVNTLLKKGSWITLTRVF
jgi:hypothetical protein